MYLRTVALAELLYSLVYEYKNNEYVLRLSACRTVIGQCFDEAEESSRALAKCPAQEV